MLLQENPSDVAVLVLSPMVFAGVGDKVLLIFSRVKHRLGRSVPTGSVHSVNPIQR